MSDCKNVQCKQVHELLDSFMALFGRMGSTNQVSATKAAIVCDEIRRIEADLDHHKQLLVERDRVLGVARDALVNAQHALRCSEGEEQPDSIAEIDRTVHQINKVLEVPKGDATPQEK